MEKEYDFSKGISFNSVEDMFKHLEERRNARSTPRKVFDFFYYPLYRFWDDWNPRMLCKRIKWLCQRIFRGFDDTTSWNLDWRISQFILPRLKHFRTMERIGIPSLMFNESDGDTDSDELHQKKLAEWNIILDKMILAFENIIQDDWDRETYKQRQAEIEEGLQLFSKYFQGLWD